jgi:large subunit ribosomal protein L19
MVSPVVAKINRENLRSDDAPAAIKIGSTVVVHCKIREGDKERIQVFKGIVIARKGGGRTATFTVRRVSHGVGVERVFPVHSPYVTKVEHESEGRARRAKLYYLRKLAGKKARLQQTRK